VDVRLCNAAGRNDHVAHRQPRRPAGRGGDADRVPEALPFGLLAGANDDDAIHRGSV